MNPTLRGFGVCAALAGMACAPPALAQSREDMEARVEVVDSCTVSATPMEFGSIDPAVDTVVDSTATITVSCAGFAFYLVDIDNGNNPSGGLRRMVSANGDFLEYQLYHNAARNNVWQSGYGGGRLGILGIFGLGDSRTYTVYGRIPNVTPALPRGSYKDTVVITLNF